MAFGYEIILVSVKGIEALLGMDIGFILEPIIIYLIFGYIVMMTLGMHSPLTPNTGDIEKDNLVISLKTIDLKKFFLDIYYTVWWPYYIIKRIKK